MSGYIYWMTICAVVAWVSHLVTSLARPSGSTRNVSRRYDAWRYQRDALIREVEG